METPPRLLSRTRFWPCMSGAASARREDIVDATQLRRECVVASCRPVELFWQQPSVSVSVLCVVCCAPCIYVVRGKVDVALYSCGTCCGSRLIGLAHDSFFFNRCCPSLGSDLSRDYHGSLSLSICLVGCLPPCVFSRSTPAVTCAQQRSRSKSRRRF